MSDLYDPPKSSIKAGQIVRISNWSGFAFSVEKDAITLIWSVALTTRASLSLSLSLSISPYPTPVKHVLP
jgi:hypothetical protein